MSRSFMTVSPDPHDPEIINLIKNQWGNFTYEIEEAIVHLKDEYLKKQARSIIALPGLVASFVGFLFSLLLGLHLVFIFTSLLSFVFIVLSLRIMYDFYVVRKKIHEIINPIIYKKVFHILNVNGQHIKRVPIDSQLTVFLKQSGLIPARHNRYAFDDIIKISYLERDIYLAELSVSNETNNIIDGKNVKLLFSGLFVSCELPKTLNGKTIITTDADKNGFGRLLWLPHTYLKDPELNETTLEWNEFEDKLHIATSDEVEARYILTPNFMQSLYDWWSTRHDKIRLSFVENKLTILYPNVSIPIGIIPINYYNKAFEKSLQDNILNIVRPLWHIQQLIDQVSTRFR